MSAVDFMTPLNLWSLWVPLVLFSFILVTAVWFVRISLR